MRCWVILIVLSVAFAVDNGLGRTPQMGYNTWNDFRCNVKANDIQKVADAFKTLNLAQYGYQYIVLDDCWAKDRDPQGRIRPDPTNWPNGMKVVADYVHSRGFKFGIYTDRGTKTCAGRPGSLGYEGIDAQSYASWGVDYLKEDSCFATDNHETAFQQYGAMRDALNHTGRPIYFSLCGWNSWYSPVGWSLGNSWRIAGDCNQWADVIRAINVNSRLAPYARPGGWNDPDMLLGSNPHTAAHLPPVQSRTMFSMWCVMAAPLLLGSSNFDAFDLTTYTNKELIAVNQDPMGVQGVRIQGGNLTIQSRHLEHNWQDLDASHANIWAKPLVDKSWAAVFINTAISASTLTCDATCFAAMGFKTTQILKARDLWTRVDKHIHVANGYTVSIPANGGSVAVRFSLTSK